MVYKDREALHSDLKAVGMVNGFEELFLAMEKAVNNVGFCCSYNTGKAL